MHRSCAIASWLSVALLVLSPAPVLAHTEGIEIRSTAPGGGQLVASHLEDLVLAALVFCANGECLWESDERSILAPADDVTIDSHFRHVVTLYGLSAGTRLRVEVVSLDAGASLKVNDAKLDAAGESTEIGRTPSVHAHTLWRIDADEDALAERTVVIRFSAASGGYAPSDAYTVRVTNVEGGGTTTTAGHEAVCGDGFVEGHETCDAGNVRWQAGHACNDACERVACGDPDDDGAVHASDALFILGSAVGALDCDVCVCNVDASTPSAVTGADALRALRVAVALEPGPLECPACAECALALAKSEATSRARARSSCRARCRRAWRRR